jgi:hypothetical protein
MIVLTFPDPWQHVYEGGVAPYMPPRRSPPVGIPVNNPPFSVPARTVAQQTLAAQAAQPDLSFYTAIGGDSPFMPRIFSIPPSVIFVPRGPLGALVINGIWQPTPSWTNLFVTQTSLGVEVDNPPRRNAFDVNSSILTAWIPPDQAPIVNRSRVLSSAVALALAAASQLQARALASSIGSLGIGARSAFGTAIRGLTTGSSAVTARLATAARSLASLLGALPINAKAAITVRGTAASSGVVGLLAREFLANFSRALTAGTVPFAGRSSFISATRGAASFLGLISARVSVTARALISSTVALSLSAASRFQGRLTALPLGVVSITGRTAFAAAARDAVTFFGAISGRAAVTARGLSAALFKLSLNAAGQLQARALASSIGALAITARSLLTNASRSLPSGAVVIAARAAMTKLARSTFGGALGLLGRTSSLIRETGAAIFLAGLVSRTTTAVEGRFGPPIGKVGIAARGAMTASIKALYSSVGTIAIYGTAALKAAVRFGPPIGTLPLAGASARMKTAAASAIGGALAILGRMALSYRTIAASNVAAGLVSTLKFLQEARAGTAGVVSILGRLTVAEISRAGSAASLALLAVSRLASTTKAAIAGAVGITARTAVTAWTRSGGTFTALISSALLGASRLSISARSKIGGAVGVAGRGAITASSRALYTSLGAIALLAHGLLSIFARSPALTSLHPSPPVVLLGDVTPIIRLKGHIRLGRRIDV